MCITKLQNVNYTSGFQIHKSENMTSVAEFCSKNCEKYVLINRNDPLTKMFSFGCVCAELKIQAMMLSPNGLLNPKASMPQLQPPPPPLPVITHTAATPTINYSQSRRASGVSMDVHSLELRSPVSHMIVLSPHSKLQ